MVHLSGTDRSQLLLLPEAIDDYVGLNNPVRFIEAFVDGLDLQAAGFARVHAKTMGRPGFDPADLLKLYIYGYLNRVRSSRGYPQEFPVSGIRQGRRARRCPLHLDRDGKVERPQPRSLPCPCHRSVGARAPGLQAQRAPPLELQGRRCRTGCLKSPAVNRGDRLTLTVKPFVRRGKNDRNDAEAISKAAARPDMPSVPVKLAEQQAQAIVLSARELLVRQRTQLVNAVRGHAAEFGVIAARNISQLPALLEAVAAEEAVPEAAKQMLAFLGAQMVQLDGQIAELERRIKQQHKVNPISQMLTEIPGIGPISALSLALTIDPGQFQSGRHFAAWLGLVPKEHSTGGRQRLGGISRAGNERLRQLLVLGATTVIRFVKPGSKSASAWLLALLERKPRKLAAVALANKMARIVWAMMATGEAYRGSKKVATLTAEAA